VAAEAPDRADAERIVRIQAGLKAFGNDGIELDGVVGARTRSAIREFQSLFGLPLTGEPDEALYAKMREIGLTN
jgi:peptidoglycan hydrolase-like protein with peptidoglycan-binding domain